jgi:proteasome assembly chaperone 3
MILESSGGSGGRGSERRGVVVGLALKDLGQAHDEDQDGDGDEDEEEEAGEKERNRFAGVLEMVAEWPGVEG